MRSSSLLVLLALLAAASAGAWYGLFDPAGDPVLIEEQAADEALAVLRVGTRAEGLAAQEGAAAQARFDDSEDWTARNNAAHAALLEGDLEAAVVGFRACFEGASEHPEHDTFRANLVEALARHARGLWDQGDRRDAMAELDEALELAEGLAGGRPDLVELRARWEREFAVEQDFWQDTSEHFELSYDARHDDLRDGYQDVIDLLEAAYADLREVFLADPVFDRGKRYRVTLYRRDRFEEVTGLHAWAGGAFDGTVRLPVTDLQRELHGMDLLLRHELVHAFVEHVGGPGVPGWYNEGLAQHLSGESSLALRRASVLLEPGFFTLDELGGSFAGWSDQDAVRRAYTQSLVLVDGIARRWGERTLVDLCADARDGGHAGIEAGYLARTGFELQLLLDDLEAELAAARGEG